MVAVNAFGDIVDPATGEIIAAPRDPDTGGLINTIEWMHGNLDQSTLGFPSNTTVAVIATDAILSKEEANKMAQMAHDGLAQAIRPLHTLLDGDTVFALATGRRTDIQTDITVVGAVGASVLAEAVIRSVRKATSLAGIPAVQDLTIK